MSYIAIFWMSNSVALTQSGWFWQNPLPQGNSLSGVYFTDANTGTVVGSLGTILRTTNGGASWITQRSGTTNYLSAISFTDAITGTVVGSFGTILHTTNGGATWVGQSSGTTNTLNAVSFTDANNGTVVGYNGTILHTTNAGTTWISQASGTPDNLLAVSFANRDNGIAVGGQGGGTLLFTTDGGSRWRGNLGFQHPLTGVSFTNSKTGTVVGIDGSIFRTIDGGIIWTAQTNARDELYAVCFTDANTGTVVGRQGTVLRTTNGGTTWASQSSGTTNDLYGVFFTDANNGTVVGRYGIILHTTNGGATWVGQSIWTRNSLSGVSFTDRNTGTAVGDLGIILRTTNGGATWTEQTSGTTNSLLAVSFSDANTGTAVGDFGRILHTTNGGAIWTAQSSAMVLLTAVIFTNANTGTVVGARGTILRTTNGGTTWSSQSSGTTDDLWGVSFTDANNGTVVGRFGTILRTTNGGTTWVIQSSGTRDDLFGVSFTDVNNGTVVGDIILRTTNGGTTWVTQSSWTTYSRAISFTDANNGTIVGSNGILHTSDGGASWTEQSSVTWNGLSAVFFTDQYNGTVVGAGGTILRTNTGGAELSLAAPTLALPANGARGVPASPTLSWNASSGAATYRLQVSTDSLFHFLVFDQSGIIATSYTMSNLATPKDTLYYWRVNATSADGTSRYSDTWSFTTVSVPPAAPTLAFPENGATNVFSSVLLMWSSSPGATSYALQVSTNSNFSTLVVDKSGITSSNYSVTGLAGITTYYWRINATGPGGTGSYSSTRSFTTGVTSPTLSSPPSGATGVKTSPTLSWYRPSGATSYTLQVSRFSDFSPTILNKSGITDTSQQVSSLAYNTLYYWRAYATNAGGSSPYSSIWSFTTTGPTLVEQLGSDIPTTYALYQNYPNPFNPGTTIAFGIPKASFVLLKVYNLLGQPVATLVNELLEAGNYRLPFDAAELPSGVYIYRLTSGDFVSTKKMVLMK